LTIHDPLDGVAVLAGFSAPEGSSVTTDPYRV
jgi:hypothetical protein